MILILIILIVIIAIGITVVMLTTGKTDITTITLTDIKKGLSSGISSVTTGKGLCPVGKVLINNECKTPKENITKETCNSQGKVLYNNKCLVKINQEYCDNKGSFLKPDPNTNFTSCTEMDSKEISETCKDNQVFFNGTCKDILKENQCSKKLFLTLDEKTKNTSCKEMSINQKNQVCLDNNKVFHDNQCQEKIDDNYCRYNSNWIHPKGEKIFYPYSDENTNYTSCRGPNNDEKLAQCLTKDFQYGSEEDKCICPNNGEIKNGKCYSLKTNDICFPKSLAKSNIATFKKPDPFNKLSCTDMEENEKNDYCKYLDSDNTTLTMNYTGNINKTKSGKTCIPWKDMTLHKNESSLDRMHPGTVEKLQKDGHNHCRDLDENGAIWCYTKNKREGEYWEECKRENLDNNLCKEWIEDENKKFLPKTDKSEKCLKAMYNEAKSNCLDMKIPYEDYITDEIRNNNYKDINKKLNSWVVNGCVKDDVDKNPENNTFTMNYQGTQNKTIDGKQCIPWSDITIYKNSFSLDRMFPGTVKKLQDETGNNYCRNLDGSVGNLWCYTKKVREGDYWGKCIPKDLSNNLCKDWIEDSSKTFEEQTDKSEKCLKNIFEEAKSNCLYNNTKYNDFITDENRKLTYNGINKFLYNWVYQGCRSELEIKNGKKKYKYKGQHQFTLPKTNTNVYNKNKCMKLYSEKECKEDKSYPNYSNNKFYEKIFYKKPDETKNNTTCRKLYKDEEKEVCEKPENNSVYVDGTCFQKLDKPTVEVLNTKINSIRIKVIIQKISKLTDYYIKYKISKISEDFKDDWLIYDFNLEQINQSDKSVSFEINKLEHNTDYKLILKVINKTYDQIQTSDSDELSIKTKCDSKIFTNNFCRTKNDDVLGPTQSDKYGLVDETKKDSSVSSWPYIKVPNKKEDGSICGCKEMDNSEEIKDWCKTNIYPNFKFNEGREVTIENNQCKISIIPVGPVENISASGLEVNQTIKNDEYLDSEFYRTDYPYRIKIYWEFPLESIKLSGNSDDAIPHTYKIERKEKSKTEWTHIHDYIVDAEIDYLNLKTYTNSDSSITSYNIYENDNDDFMFCDNDCYEDSSVLICNDKNKKFNCISKDKFERRYKKQKSINVTESFTDNSESLGCQTTECLKKQHTKFIWIDGDYGLETLFKPNKLPSFNDINKTLKPNTNYEYRITPVNKAGPGKSIIVNAKTINKKLDFQDCNKLPYDDINSDYYNNEYGISDFKGFSKVLNDDHNSCRKRNPRERNEICSNLKFNVDGKEIVGMYDNDTLKCIPFGEYKTPGKPSVTSENITKKSIGFTIIPPEEKGSPELTGYLVKWERKNSLQKGRLIFYSNFNKNSPNVVRAISEIPQRYIQFPSNEWNDSESDITTNDSITIIHNQDENSSFLLPDTDYIYTISAISQSDLWKSSPQGVNKLNDGGLVIGSSNTTRLTYKTLVSSPVATPEITFRSENQSNDKTIINIKSFPYGKEGGKTVSVVKYKIIRTNYDMTAASSNLINLKEFLIDFSQTSNVITKFIELNESKEKIEKENTDNKYFTIRTELTSAAINSSNKLIFEDKTVVPFTKYNYKILCMNNEVNEWSDSIYTNSIDITTPSLDHKTEINFKNSIIISDIRKLPEGFNIDKIDEFPNIAFFKVSLNEVIDPNVELYKKYTDFYKTTYQKHEFILNYNSVNGSLISVIKNINLQDTNAEKILYIPYNRQFEIEFKSQFQGELKIPGRKNQTIISNGIKKLSSQIINSTDPKINLNESTCNKYKEFYDTKGYEINYFYNEDKKKCQSRKPSYNNSQYDKLNDFCETKLSTSKWYGNDEEEPCKIPIDGKWEEEVLIDTIKNICKDSSDKINGETRICLNDGKAFSLEKRWRYIPPQYGGNDLEKPSESEIVKKDPTTNIPLNAYKFKECSLEKCSIKCSNLFGNLTDAGEIKTGFRDIDIGNNDYCNKGSFQPAVKNDFSNCESCGNPAGKTRTQEWLRTNTCINGYNSNEINLIDCKYSLSDNSSPIVISPKPTGNFEYGKWYQCKATGISKFNMDPKFNNILDSNGNKFCDPPFKEVTTLKATLDSSGNETGENQVLYLPKYFKIEKTECIDENNGNFPLCPIKETTPIDYSDETHICGTVSYNQDIKCIKDGEENSDLWSCTNTLTEDMTPNQYYNKYLNTGNTKKIWNYEKQKCKDKCEGPDSEISPDGYDKWNGEAGSTPYYNNKEPLYMSSTYENIGRKSCAKSINHKREDNQENNTLEKCQKTCTNKKNNCNGIIFFDSLNSGDNPTGYHCTTYNCEGLRSTDTPAHWGNYNFYKKINVGAKCEKKDLILPLYQEGVVETPCLQCNPKSVPMKKYDLCIDGKYGPEDKIKCSKATKFRKGNAQTFVADPNDSEIISPQKYDKHEFEGSDLVNLSGFNSNRYQSESYNEACDYITCNYDTVNMQKEFITDDSVKRCRGDYKYKNLICKSSKGNSIDLNDPDIENKCEGIEIDKEIEGNKKCTRVDDITIMFNNNEDYGSEITNLSDKNKIRTCNDPLDPREYYTHFKCLDDEGNKVASTYLGNKEDNTLGKSKIEQNKIINCYTNNGEVSIQPAYETISQKECNCNCIYTHTDGTTTDFNIHAATGTQCTERGANICSSCPDNMEKSGTGCVCKQHYIWSTSQKNCIRAPVNCNESLCTGTGTGNNAWSNVGAPEMKEGTNQSQTRNCPVTDPLTNSTKNDGQGLYGGTSCSVSRKINVAIPQQNCVYKNSWHSNTNCNQKLESSGEGPFNGGISCPQSRTRKTINIASDATKANNGTNKNRNRSYTKSETKSRRCGSRCYWGRHQVKYKDYKDWVLQHTKCGNGTNTYKSGDAETGDCDNYEYEGRDCHCRIGGCR